MEMITINDLIELSRHSKVKVLELKYNKEKNIWYLYLQTIDSGHYQSSNELLELTYLDILKYLE